MSKAKSLNMTQVRDDYVQGWKEIDPVSRAIYVKYPTLQEVADKHGYSAEYLRQISARQKWSRQRQVFQERIEGHIQEQKVSVFLSQSAKFDASVLDQVEKLSTIISREIDRICPPEPEEDYSRDGEIEETSIDVNNLFKLVQTLEKIQDIGRKACREPVSGISQDIYKDIQAKVTPIDKEARSKKISQLSSRRDQLLKDKQRLAASTTETK